MNAAARDPGNATTAPSQAEVKQWFDAVYASEGFSYLRPPQAYPIYLQLLGAQPGERLLDVGCGPGLLVQAAVARGLRASGVDISDRAIELGREFVPAAELRACNAEQLPFEDGTFQIVTGIGVLERFFDRARALAEIRRVARSDARFCFMVRNADAIGWRFWRQLLRRQNVAGHQDAMNLRAWRELFEANGFVVRDVLIDQWMRQKLRRVLRGFRPHDFREPEPIAKPVLPMRLAYEFIFILEKAST